MVDGPGRYVSSLASTSARLYHQVVVVAESATDKGPAVDVERRGTLIPPDELHVWSASLERSPVLVAQLRVLLTGDERERASRFRFERDRSRYIVGRGLLRILLGRYLGVAPADVRFEYGAFEKPRLAGGELWFNLSHSGTIALFAFSARGEVGIDVELDDADFAGERIAERFFSPAEVRALRSLPAPQQARAFLHCWTRKEAFIKARGDGLSLALDSFDVTLEPGSPAVLLRTAWSDDEPGHWQLLDLSDPGSGYVAAVAIRSEGWRVINRRVPDNFHDDTLTRQEER
jgi:4'-phosphopantetheinyl transferase